MPSNYCEAFVNTPAGDHCEDGLLRGWSAIWSDTLGHAVPDEPGRIELQNVEKDGCVARDGSQKAELDSHHRYVDDEHGDNDIYLYQVLQTCPNKLYTLSYSYRPRRRNTADMDVWVDAKLLCSHSSAAPPDPTPIPWEDVTVYFTSGDYPTELGFNACSCGDTYGPFLDAVSVHGPTPGDPECDDGPICGERPNTLTFFYNGELVYDGDTPGYHDQDPGEVIIWTKEGLTELPDTVFIEAYNGIGKYKNATRGKKVRSDDGLLYEWTVPELTALFTVVSGGEKADKWLPPTMMFKIYSEDGMTLLQTVQFHTSCSQPLDIGDQFGPIVVAGGGRN
jgi:hypothetical protein